VGRGPASGLTSLSVVATLPPPSALYLHAPCARPSPARLPHPHPHPSTRTTQPALSANMGDAMAPSFTTSMTSSWRSPHCLASSRPVSV
jgi:hypothetical protein